MAKMTQLLVIGGTGMGAEVHVLRLAVEKKVKSASLSINSSSLPERHVISA